MLQIQNCTASFKFSSIPLSTETYLKIARHGYNTIYDPSRFHAIIMRLPHSHHHRNRRRIIAALIFKSGKVVLTGLPHPDIASKLAERITKRLKASMVAAGLDKEECGKISVTNLVVTNIVGSYTHPKRISIEQMYQHLRKISKNGPIHAVRYDPTIFPALRFKLSHCKSALTDSFTATCLVYTNGKTIVTGLRHHHPHFDLIFPRLHSLFLQFANE